MVKAQLIASRILSGPSANLAGGRICFLCFVSTDTNKANTKSPQKNLTGGDLLLNAASLEHPKCIRSSLPRHSRCLLLPIENITTPQFNRP